MYSGIFLASAWMDIWIDSLNKLLASLNDKAHKSTILHHIGKLYFKIGEDAIALGKFEEVLELKKYKKLKQ